MIVCRIVIPNYVIAMLQLGTTKFTRSPDHDLTSFYHRKCESLKSKKRVKVYFRSILSHRIYMRLLKFKGTSYDY